MTNFSKLFNELVAVAIHDYRQARSDWYFAKKQMDAMQRTNLRKEDD